MEFKPKYAYNQNVFFIHNDLIYNKVISEINCVQSDEKTLNIYYGFIIDENTIYINENFVRATREELATSIGTDNYWLHVNK